MAKFLDLTEGKVDSFLRRILPEKVTHLTDGTVSTGTLIHFVGGGEVECSFPPGVVQSRIEAHLAEEATAESRSELVACNKCGEGFEPGSVDGRVIDLTSRCLSCLGTAKTLPPHVLQAAHDCRGKIVRWCPGCGGKVLGDDQVEFLELAEQCVLCWAKTELVRKRGKDEHEAPGQAET